jgi:hypothetical protein
MAPTYRVTVKRSQDQGLSRVKKALDNKENPLSRLEIEFTAQAAIFSTSTVSR